MYLFMLVMNNIQNFFNDKQKYPFAFHVCKINGILYLKKEKKRKKAKR